MNSSVGNSTEWMQFYEQTVDDATTINVTTSTISSDGNLSMLTSKGYSSKPMRRRPRASKKKPATLLNANARNFRALVQQFTGCPTTTHLSTNGRGSINLNFALGTEHNQSGTATMPVTGNDYYHHHQQQQQHSHQENASYHHHPQQQQHAVSFDNVDPNAYVSSSSTRANADDQILDEFGLDNISLQEFNRDFPYSNENTNDGNYFL